ncbi:hypothetical protein FRC12_000626 [Ceratobasidium sp. 428]|nr:hypothetical protein FRC12_000626 [Ceratobasidium sp. 428]
MSTSNKLASSSSVFNTPELLVLICKFLEAEECVPLLTASQACFPIAASRVWAQVDNARVLLALLGVKITGDGSYEAIKNHPHISLYGTRNFKRFEFYAPLVRHLNVYGNECHHFKISNWYTLFQQARKGPLLPNLSSLTLNAADSIFAVDQMLWISIFASPSLLRFKPIHIRDSNKACVSELAAAIILKTISDRCPNMQSLYIYPTRENGEGDTDGESCLLNIMWPGPYLPYLQSLLGLRSLSTSLAVIDGDGLPALGGLPQLETLTIRGCNEYLHDENFAVPANSFPRLMSLTLWEIYVGVVRDLMAIQPLVRRLTHLSICHWFEEEEAEEQTEWFEGTIPLLLQNIPGLESLYYDATYNISPFDFDIVRGGISHSFLERTSKLRTLYLTGFEIQSVGVLECMPASWSMLTDLCLVHGVISPALLPYFAKLPNLQKLTLQLQFSHRVDWPVFDGGRGTGLTLHTIVNTENRVELDAGVAASDIARCFLSLWPNLSFVDWPAVYGSSLLGSILPSRQLLVEINAWIRNASRESVVAQGDVEMAQT